jgi:hypothetical protein
MRSHEIPCDLWHYTCRHAAQRIGRRGDLEPHAQPALEGRVVLWATDLAEPDRDALGLTSTILPCDRTEVRYRILEPDAFEPWTAWWPGQRINPQLISQLTHPPHAPKHWYVAVCPALAGRA